MGRKDKSVATYGRHRQRVVAADVWSSDDDKKKHLFSFSTGSINFSSTDSEGSWLESAKKPSTAAQTKNSKKDSKVVKNKGVNKENRYTRKPVKGNQKGKRFTVFSETDKDSCSSTGGESLALSDKPGTRRVLRDRNIPSDSSVSTNPTPRRPTRRQRQTRNNAANKDKDKDSASYNFSEFEDYSLCVLSGTPQNPKEKTRAKTAKSGIETSTPFRDTRRKKSHIVEEIKDADLSLIDPVEDSPVVSDMRGLPDSPHSSSDVSRVQISNYVASPSLLVSSKNDKIGEPGDSQLSDACLKDCQVKLSQLEESINSMHIDNSSQNSVNHSNMNNSSVRSFQQSQSLFDSPMESKSTHLSKNLADAARQISPYTCLVELQKMRESFIRTQLSDSSPSPVTKNVDKKLSNKEDTAPCTSNERNFLSRKLRSRDVHGAVSGNDLEGSDVCISEESDEELDESWSCSEEEEEEDLSDIYEDEEDEEEEDDSVDEQETPEMNSDPSDGLNETRYVLTEKGMNGEWSEEMASMNSSSFQEMDISQSHTSLIQKSVYFSAESDGSLYHTADGSNSVRDEKASHRKLRNKHLDRTREDGNLSRSFVEMLTPTKKTRSAPPPPSPRSKLFNMCEQDKPLSFYDIIPDNMMKKIVKIGEGVYGEVFRAQRNGKSVAIKIIPIEGDFEVNDEPQKTFAEILPEVVISKELSGLRWRGRNTTPSFCQVISAACVRGCYPDHLLKQWDIYNKKRKSENDRPDMFGEDQLFVVFEFADGGTDLESYQFATPWQARSVLQQVSISLAVAEEELEFEHRDLHIGNVLVRATDNDERIEYRLADGTVEVDSHGVTVSIIDFTLSRLRKDGCTVFCDLAKDDALFEGSGDYQFDIYRNMKEENKNEWEAFNPHSNILWLHYLGDKLLKQKRYKRNGREDREAMRYLRQFQAEVLTYHSAKHLILESELFQT